MGIIVTTDGIVERVTKLLPTREQLIKRMRESYRFDDEKDSIRALDELARSYETNIAQFCPYGVDDCGGHYIQLGNALNNLLNRREESIHVYHVEVPQKDLDANDDYEQMEGRAYLFVRENDFSDTMDYWFCEDCRLLLIVLDGYSLNNLIQETP